MQKAMKRVSRVLSTSPHSRRDVSDDARAAVEQERGSQALRDAGLDGATQQGHIGCEASVQKAVDGGSQSEDVHGRRKRGSLRARSTPREGQSRPARPSRAPPCH